MSVMCTQLLSWKQHWNSQFWLSTWLDWAMPRKLVKHTARCVCEGISRGHWWLGQLSGEHMLIATTVNSLWARQSKQQRKWGKSERWFLNTCPFPFFLSLSMNVGLQSFLASECRPAMTALGSSCLITLSWPQRRLVLPLQPAVGQGDCSASCQLTRYHQSPHRQVCSVALESPDRYKQNFKELW